MAEPLVGFKASTSWLLKFKKRFGIVSRKINKFVTLAQVENPEQIIATAKNFVEEVNDFVRANKITSIINADQSGFKVICLFYMINFCRFVTKVDVRLHSEERKRSRF
jgi:hypothetical protein